MKHSTLNLAFEKLENQRHQIFKQLGVYDDKILNKRPSENGWSVIEVITHLIVAEALSHQYLSKKILDPSATQNVGLKEALKSVALGMYLASPKKFKAPAISMPTGPERSLSEVDAIWEAGRKQLSDIWVHMPEELLDRNWFKHPAAGKLSLMQMLSFMKAHVAHHEKQIARTLKAVG